MLILGLLAIALIASGCPSEPTPTFTVTYHSNGATGGTVPVDASQYEQNAQATVLANTGNLTKTGASFQGWNTASDGSGTSYAPGATFSMPAANVILYAKWLDTGELDITAVPSLNVSVKDCPRIVGDTQTITVRGTANKPVDGWEWFIDGVSVASGATTDSYMLDGSSLAMGLHEIAVVVATATEETAASVLFEAVDFITISEDFEDGLVAAPFVHYSDADGSYDWENDANWTVTDETAFEGIRSARSGPVGHDGFTYIDWEGTVPAGQTLYSVSFRYKTSTERWYDELLFETYESTDGYWTDYIEDSGFTDWMHVTIYPDIQAGDVYSLSWGYVKDGSYSSGSDCVWVDDIVVTFIQH